MGRNYGSLGGNRRSGGGAWQWFVLGTILGLGCSITLVLAAIATGFLYLDVEGAPGRETPTALVQVITATPAPVTPTEIPTQAPLATATSQQIDIAPPTPTELPPTPESLIQVEPSATTFLAPSNNSDEGDGGGQNTGGSQIAGASNSGQVPPELTSLLSPAIDIAGGTFEMGTTAAEVRTAVDACVADGGDCQLAYGEDSSPPHSVTLDPFQMERDEVTYGQYLTFLNFLGPRSHLNGCEGFQCIATQNETDASNVSFDSANYRVQPFLENYPVAGVTWYGAKAYCEAIGRRLPTEAEWERAGKGSQGRIYPWGNDRNVNNSKTSRPVVDTEQRGAVPVGSYPTGASENGLLDMAGNVEEWVADWYSETYYRQPESIGLNPQGPPVGTQKVLRGGSWAAMPFFSRTMHRRSLEPDQSSITVGFRCAADPATNTGAGGVDLNSQAQPTIDAAGTGAEENTAGSQPTLPPPPGSNVTPTTSAPQDPLATLPPGG